MVRFAFRDRQLLTGAAFRAPAGTDLVWSGAGIPARSASPTEAANIAAIREAMAVRRYLPIVHAGKRNPRDDRGAPEVKFGVGNTLELSFDQQIRFEGVPRLETAW
jgi:hypothetical protein